MSARLTRPESFRARAWRDIQRRPDVATLSNRAHRLLVGIVHQVLTPYNNGAINLGPATMGRLGFTSKSNAECARGELINSRLLLTMTDGRRGARTYYALSFLPLALDARNLPLRGEVSLPPGGEVTPQNLPPGGEDLPLGGEV